MVLRRDLYPVSSIWGLWLCYYCEFRTEGRESKQSSDRLDLWLMLSSSKPQRISAWVLSARAPDRFVFEAAEPLWPGVRAEVCHHDLER